MANKNLETYQLPSVVSWTETEQKDNRLESHSHHRKNVGNKKSADEEIRSREGHVTFLAEKIRKSFHEGQDVARKSVIGASAFPVILFLSRGSQFAHK